MPKQTTIIIHEDFFESFLPGYSAEIAAEVMQAGSDSRKPSAEGGKSHRKKLTAIATNMFGGFEEYRRS